MFKENVDALAAHLENLVKTKTVIGEPIITGNITIIPIITASFGFATGVGEGTDPSKGGGKGNGGGAGGKLSPTALIVIKEDDVHVYSLDNKGSLEKLIELVPELMSKLACNKPTQNAQ
jgi:uncharacterized spore protein YtfJ